MRLLQPQTREELLDEDEPREDFNHVGSLVIPDQTSPLFGIHHFYLNNKGMAAFKKSGSYPEGTIFVGKVYAADDQKRAANEGKMRFYTYMEKTSKGADTGGRLFAAFSPEGTFLEKDVKKECFDCHTSQKDADYVFSKPLKEVPRSTGIHLGSMHVWPTDRPQYMEEATLWLASFD